MGKCKKRLFCTLDQKIKLAGSRPSPPLNQNILLARRYFSPAVTLLEIKMAAGLALRRVPPHNSSTGVSKLFLPCVRNFAAKTKIDIREQPRKNQDEVYLLNYRAPPAHSFSESLSVLRAYAISGYDETMELHLKLNMGEKKVNDTFSDK